VAEVVLVRHGETAWSRVGRHTSVTDVGLTEVGRAQGAALAAKLAHRPFHRVFTSPRARAAETARLAGFAAAEPVEDLREWNYGAYEGRTTSDIRAGRPGWDLWDDGAPDGETVDDIAVRADHMITVCDETSGDVLLFGHAHKLRVFAVRWVDLDGTAGRLLALDPASIGTLGYEREQRVIRLWNEPA
jgi:probable phosphoglycerate mutase